MNMLGIFDCQVIFLDIFGNIVIRPPGHAEGKRGIESHKEFPLQANE